MQQVQRSFGAEVRAGSPDAPPSVVAGGYGFGLFVFDDPDLGTIVSHSGGYPGFGSNMCWHPATGLGVIALGNLRYAPVTGPAMEQLAVLVRDGHAARRAVRPDRVVERYRDVAEGLIAAWDDAVADEAFAMNMDLDEPRDRRRAAVAAVAEAIGPSSRDGARPAVSASSAHCRWWLRGERGWAAVEIMVTPEPAPRLQTLLVTAVGDPSAALAEAAERLLAAAAEQAPAWPEALAAAETLDTAAVGRALRAGAARFGRMTRGLPVAGDGAVATTWDLVTERGGRATLKVALDAETGAVTEASLLAAARQPPHDAC
jgi:hypothetical protein